MKKAGFRELIRSGEIDAGRVGKTRKTRMSIGLRLALITLRKFALAGIVMAGCIFILMLISFLKLFNASAEKLVANAATLVDGNVITQYLDTMEPDEYYDTLKEQLSYTAGNSDVDFICIYVPEETFATYIMEVGSDEETSKIASKLGETFEYLEEDYRYYAPAVLEGRPSEGLNISDDPDVGVILYAWMPISDSTGKNVAVIEADYIIDELIDKIWDYLAGIGKLMLVCMLVLFVSMAITNWKHVSGPLRRFKSYVESYESGHFTKKPIRLKYNDEIRWLKESFEEMAGKMDRYVEDIRTVTAEKERIGAELDVAAGIQSSMLPSIFPVFSDREDFEICASMNPAKEVGGDFYDFFMIDETHLAVVVADVSGKGIPAALFMVIGKTLIKDHTGINSDLGEVFAQVNRILCENNSEDMFITAFEGVLDIQTGEFTYVNAGHEIPYICRAGGEYEPYRIKAGFVLAGMNGIRYKSGSVTLNPGDRFFQYTDGVTEATDADNNAFGNDRLQASLNANRTASQSELIKAVKDDISAFTGSAPQFDDITMLAFEYKGPAREI